MLGAKFEILSTVFLLAKGFGPLAPLTPHCKAPYDVLQVQDATSSFDNLWPSMAAQVPAVVEMLYNTHPDTRFGFVTFGDKPLNPLGYGDDYCVSLDVPLGRQTPQSLKQLFLKYHNDARGGGNDWPEASLDAVVRTLSSDAMKWTEKPSNQRMLVLVTDALPHVEGDVESLSHTKVDPFNPSDEDLMADPNAKCANMDYPSIGKVVEVLKKTGTDLIVVAAPAGVYIGGKFSPYRNIAYEGKKYRKEDGLALWYSDKFAEHGLTITAVPVDSKMEGYADAFRSGLVQVLRGMCESTVAPETTTPTAAPTDTTTAAPTDTTTECTTTAETTTCTYGSTTTPDVPPTTPHEGSDTTHQIPDDVTTGADCDCPCDGEPGCNCSCGCGKPVIIVVEPCGNNCSANVVSQLQGAALENPKLQKLLPAVSPV